MESILVIIGAIYYNQFECNHLKYKKRFVPIYCFLNLYFGTNLEHLKKKHDLHSLSISQIIDSKRCGYLNA